MFPGGAERDANVALRLGPVDGDAEAVRADQPCAMGADEGEQALLAVDPVAARLRQSPPR